MSIRRTITPADHFTIVPNDWLRDQSLSWKARGLLAYLMSHTTEWTTSVAALVRAGTDGKDAVLSGVRELEQAGYLVRTQSRTVEGQFGETDYDLVDPSAPLADYPATVEPATVEPATVRPTPKKTNLSENQLLEAQEHPHSSAAIAAEGEFEVFWRIWPRKVGKRNAESAYWRAVSRGGSAAVMAGAQRYAENPHCPEEQFIPHPTTWLNRDGWLDQLPGPRTNGKATPTDRAMASMQSMLGGRGQMAVGS